MREEGRGGVKSEEGILGMEMREEKGREGKGEKNLPLSSFP